MTSNKQFPSNVYKLATFVKAGNILRSEGNSALLPASAHDQTVTEGGMLMMQLMFTSSACHIFQTFFPQQRKLYNKSLNDRSLGKQWILFPSQDDWDSKETKFQSLGV